MRIIHQEQRDPVVRRDVAETDILAVAAEIREGESLVVDNAEETGRPAAMLHIRPAGLRYACHVETVARGDKFGFRRGETDIFFLAFEIRPERAAAVHLLRSLDAWRCRDLEET